MMLVKSEIFQLDFILRNQGVELFEAIQVVSSRLCRYDTTHSTKIHTRFQLRIVVDVAQCQLLLYFFIIPQIQKSFSGSSRYKQFSQGIMAPAAFTSTALAIVSFFIWNSFKCFIFYKNKGSWLF
jgi:hypothetical protein